MKTRQAPLFSIPQDPDAKLLPARRLLSAAGFGTSIVNVERLAKIVGIRRIERIPTSDIDACLIPDKYGYTVLVSKDLKEGERRFAVAHEIGHVLLGARCKKFRAATKRMHAREIDCDLLASELLMPVTPFKRDLQECEPSLSWVESLAVRYEVPVEMAAMRMAELSPDAVEVICWERQGSSLVPRWSTGSSILRTDLRSQTKKTSFGNFSNHAVRAFNSRNLSMKVRQVGPNRRTVAIQSKRYGSVFAPYVLTLASYVRAQVKSRESQ